MNKIFIIILTSLISLNIFGQAGGEDIYTISENNIITKNKYIDSFYLDNTEILTPYIIKQESTLHNSIQYGSLSLKLYKFNGYESEPGFCNVIEILRDGTQILCLKNSNGFKSISSIIPSETGLYSSIFLAENTYALVFNEWIYASQPAMVSIILLRNGQASLVYNKPMFINSITKQSGNFNMVLQSNTVEYEGLENPTPTTTPILHTIYWDGHILKFN